MFLCTLMRPQQYQRIGRCILYILADRARVKTPLLCKLLIGYPRRTPHELQG